MGVDTTFRNASSSYPPGIFILTLPYWSCFYIPSMTNSKTILTKLLISSCYRIISCCTQRNLMWTFTKWTLMVKVSYTPKLMTPLDSRKQFKRHVTLVPFSPSASPFSFLLFIIRREDRWSRRQWDLHTCCQDNNHYIPRIHWAHLPPLPVTASPSIYT